VGVPAVHFECLQTIEVSQTAGSGLRPPIYTYIYIGK
jgi:hypothetical protein